MRSSKVLFLFIAILSIAGLAQAQFYVGVQGGMGFSSFDSDIQVESATAIPLAVTVGTDLLPIIDVGAEANFLVSPYKFNVDGGGEVKFNQNYYGAYLRWYVLPLPAITPYVKGGVGYYTGKLSGDGDDVNMKGSMGFNIGAGVDLLMGLYGEVVYNIVSMEPDVEGGVSKKFNSVQVMVGYSFDLL